MQTNELNLLSRLLLVLFFLVLTYVISYVHAEQIGENGGLQGEIIRPGSSKAAQSPSISPLNLPPDFPSELRPYVENLYSKTPGVCMQSIKTLSSMGPGALPVVPFLIERIGDNRLVGSLQVRSDFSGGFVGSSIGEEAAKALGKITGQNIGEDSLEWNDWWRQNQPHPEPKSK